jgi:hypothetical protein
LRVDGIKVEFTVLINKVMREDIFPVDLDVLNVVLNTLIEI